MDYISHNLIRLINNKVSQNLNNITNLHWKKEMEQLNEPKEQIYIYIYIYRANLNLFTEIRDEIKW